MLFDWYNKIEAGGLFNVFEVDSMSYKKLVSKKKVIKLS